MREHHRDVALFAPIGFNFIGRETKLCSDMDTIALLYRAGAKLSVADNACKPHRDGVRLHPCTWATVVKTAHLGLARCHSKGRHASRRLKPLDSE
jgi:hypothetical protein